MNNNDDSETPAPGLNREEGTNKIHSEIGPGLARLRNEKGFTQTELAEKLKINQGTLSKIEHGRALPDLETWIEICRLFDLPFNYPKASKPKPETE
jgi:DNA-binding XRE family transcriptional regulator